MEKIKNIIFLDIDGVLNSDYWSKTHISNIKCNVVKDGETSMIDPKAVMIIKEICDTTNAKIIISSSWRYSTIKATVEDFNRYVDMLPILPYIVAVTPKYGDRAAATRGVEIKLCLNEIQNKECINERYLDGIEFDDNFNYVIIDDDNDMLISQENNFVQTDFMYGITEHDKLRVCSILNRK